MREGQEGIRFGILLVWLDRLREWNALHDYVDRIERYGFDSLWLTDHPLAGGDCWTHLSALAVTTRRIRLGTLAACATYRNPVLLARMAADVDRLSNGRLILGIGAGDDPAEHERMGIAFDPPRVRLEALASSARILNALLAGETVSSDGPHLRVREAALSPAGAQPPRIPLLIAGGGEKVTLRLVAQHADASNFGAHPATGGAWAASEIRRKLSILNEFCVAEGRDPASVLPTQWAPPVFLAGSSSGAEAKLSALTARQRANYGPHVFAGTPAKYVAHLAASVDAGIRYFIVNPWGDDETLDLLAHDVLPSFARAA